MQPPPINYRYTGLYSFQMLRALSMYPYSSMGLKIGNKHASPKTAGVGGGAETKDWKYDRFGQSS